MMDVLEVVDREMWCHETENACAARWAISVRDAITLVDDAIRKGVIVSIGGKVLPVHRKVNMSLERNKLERLVAANDLDGICRWVDEVVECARGEAICECKQAEEWASRRCTALAAAGQLSQLIVKPKGRAVVIYGIRREDGSVELPNGNVIPGKPAP